jgi:amidase/aspartyl-tRNA(Asn)/glutamyl-tRNA(Gln) amidotransferase subunit A
MWPTSTDGMPLGVQIIAAPWREDLAIVVARQLSEAGVAHVKTAAC